MRDSIKGSKRDQKTAPLAVAGELVKIVLRVSHQPSKDHIGERREHSFLPMAS